MFLNRRQSDQQINPRNGRKNFAESYNDSARFSLLAILAALLIVQGCARTEADTAPMETLPMKRISLENLEAFRPVAANWRIAGAVTSYRHVEHDLNGLEGGGILVNIPDGDNNDHLFTAWMHGDLELELDVLMPNGSNSGIFLMGRYEVQLLDSWGVDDPQFSDIGGINQRWDESRPEGQKGFGGSAPRMKAARAPGLWQHLRILFRAPEFGESGAKVSNALLEEVWLNGVLVQEDVEVGGPTRAAAYSDEQATGPLMIQGDQGPVAVRNIRYKRYDKKKMALTDLSYEYYADVTDDRPDFSSRVADETGSVDSLDGSMVSRDDRYALRFTGTLETPNSGTYLFKLRNAGTVRMLIDERVVFVQERPYRMHELMSQTLDLESGQHNFTLEYVDHPNNWYTGLSLLAEGPQLRVQKFHASSSVPGGDRELPDLVVEADDRIKVIRSFAMHRGSKRTHVVNVGAPNHMNFSYDLGQAALLHAWEGSFLNTNEMWINRGEPQTASPHGPPVIFAGKPSLARLNQDGGPWPDSLSWQQLDVKGYRIPDDGWPVFLYTIASAGVEDRLAGSRGERRLRRTVRFSAPEPREDLWFQLASGKEIATGSDGEYVIDDRSYYLIPVETDGAEPEIVRNEDSQDLRVQVLADGTESEITYEIIW